MLTAPIAAVALLEAIEYERHAEHAYVLAYAIMPDHLHLLLVPREPMDVSTVMHNLKSFSGKIINRGLERTGPVWQKSLHDRVIRNERQLETAIEYIIETGRREACGPCAGLQVEFGPCFGSDGYRGVPGRMTEDWC